MDGMSERENCSVVLVEQQSQAKCILGTSFGCIPGTATIWTQMCRGRFSCAPHQVSYLCGYPPSMVRRNCSCDGHDKGAQREILPVRLTTPPLPRADCDEVGFDAVAHLHNYLLAAGLVSTKPLVVAIGVGTTATRSLAQALRHLGLRTLHFDDEAVIRTLLLANPSRYPEIDFPKLLAPYDAVADMPIPQLYPFILAAFPNARALHTVRGSLEWVRKRSSMDGLGPGAAKPFAALYSSLGAVPTNHMWLRKRNISTREENVLGLRQHTSQMMRFTDAIAYSAESAYYRCITPQAQYMRIRPFEGEMCEKGFAARLAHFVNRSLPKRPFDIDGCARSS